MTLRTEQLTKIYSTREALCECNLELQQGEKIALLGPNGAGKTTLLKLLCGLLRPTRGNVTVNGLSARSMREHIAYSSDDEDVYPWMTPRDAQRAMNGLYKDFKVKKFQDLCELLKVPAQSFSTLSKGEKRRFKLCMTLARSAKFYLLDEPLSGIDIVSREQTLQAMMYDWEPEATLVLSTHEFEGAQNIFSRILFIKDGKICADEARNQIEDKGLTIVERYREIFR